MKWYRQITASIGHGDTFDGKMLKQELERLIADVSSMRTAAISGGPEDVLQRWKGEIRRQMLMLPSVEVLPRMSMMELKELSTQVSEIKGLIQKYSEKRYREIVGAD